MSALVVEGGSSRRGNGNTHILPLIALALCSSSGFRGWTGVVCSGGEREVKPGYAPGSRVWRGSQMTHLLQHMLKTKDIQTNLMVLLQ